MNTKMRCVKFFVSVCVLLASGILCGCAEKTVYSLQKDTALAEETLQDPVDPVSDGDTDLSAASGEVPDTEPETIWVYVCGAVRSPGVYELSRDSRVYEALEAAGGPAKDAELRSLNQAACLTDGEQITVYTVREIEESGGLAAGAEAAGAPSGKVNLNTAGQEELMSLSGIGETRARAILAYREEHGPFLSIEEIMNIEGIKEKSFSKIKDKIEV